MLLLSLFVPRDCISFIHGKRIGNAINWTIENPDLIQNLREVIESQAIPFFESVSTFPGILACVKKDVESDWPRYNSHHLEELAYLYIKDQEYPAALESLGRLQRDLENETTPWIVNQRNRAQLIEAKLLESPESALKQLEEWKKQTIIRLGLEKYTSSN